MRREIIEAIGGWDEKALAEDTEISFRIYMMGYKIKFQPKAVTWEQEPQTLKVWFRQRTQLGERQYLCYCEKCTVIIQRKST